MEQKCSNCGNGKWRDGVTAITDTCTKCHYVDKGALGIQPNNWKPKEQTNADRIRAMSDVELVLFLEEFSFTGCPAPGKDCGESCRDCMMEWLKQPVEE